MKPSNILQLVKKKSSYSKSQKEARKTKKKKGSFKETAAAEKKKHYELQKRTKTLIRDRQKIPSALEIKEKKIILSPDIILYAFQTELIHKMLYFYLAKRSPGVYNGSDQGLGKTLMAIATAKTLTASKILIICPASLRGNWEDEIRICAPEKVPTIRTIYTHRDLQTGMPTASWVITSFEMLFNKGIFSKLDACRWDMVVVDEAQNIVNFDARRTSLCMHFCKKAKRWMFLSGTPVRKCSDELFPVLNLLYPEQFNNIWEFRNTYAKKVTTRIPAGKWQGVQRFKEFSSWTGSKNDDDLVTLMKENFFVRKLKSSVIKELPPKVFQRISLDCPNLSSTCIDEQFARDCIRAVTDGTPMPKRKYKHVATTLQEIAAAKLAQCSSHIEETLDAGYSKVLFVWHKNILHECMKMFERYNPQCLYGETPKKQGHKLVSQFNSGVFNLFIVQIKAGGVGINLHGNCHICGFLETGYDPQLVYQAVDRLHRIGQTEQVHAYIYSARNTYEDKVAKILIEKRKFFETIIQET